VEATAKNENRTAVIGCEREILLRIELGQFILLEIIAAPYCCKPFRVGSNRD
jgi:hypothetical protein